MEKEGQSAKNAEDGNRKRMAVLNRFLGLTPVNMFAKPTATKAVTNGR
jgi:hypothetical protein